MIDLLFLGAFASAVVSACFFIRAGFIVGLEAAKG